MGYNFHSHYMDVPLPFYNFSIPSNQKYRPLGEIVSSQVQLSTNSLLILAIKLKLAKFSRKIIEIAIHK